MNEPPRYERCQISKNHKSKSKKKKKISKRPIINLTQPEIEILKNESNTTLYLHLDKN